MNLRLWVALRRWIDNDAHDPSGPDAHRRIDWPRVLPFLLIHLGCVGIIAVGTSSTAIGVALALYAIRMFAITAFYHRYFAHRAFKTSRSIQFVFAIIGASAVKRGKLWWASNHRHHHRHSDAPPDSHSPRQHGFLWSHLGWFLARENFAPRMALVRDLAAYPELRWLDRFDTLIPTALAILLYAFGAVLEFHAPGLGATGLQLLVWGFCVSTVALYHSTFAINSMAHRFGTRRYATGDDSRNNLWLALITFGEGWHNNHHHSPGAARQGFLWHEIDLTYYGLRVLCALGLVRELRLLPKSMRNARRLLEKEKAT